MRASGSAPRPAARSLGARVESRQPSRSSEQAACWRSADRRAKALSLSSELAKQFPDATLTIRVSLPVTAAAAGHRARRAGARARTSGARQAGPSRPVLGVLARLPPGPGVPSAEGRPSGRRRVPEHPGPSRRGAGLGAVSPCASRSRPCGGARQRHGKARKAYDDFLALWNQADPDLRPLKEARRERSELQ